jgi:hypothetical protein
LSELLGKLINWILKDVFMTVSISVIAGVSVYYLPKIISKIYHKFRPVLTYQLDDFGNGQRRRVHHSYGERVDDKNAKNGKAWEHTNNRDEEKQLVMDPILRNLL